jgi:hypothetical protein
MLSNDVQLFGDAFRSSDPVDPMITPLDSDLDGVDSFPNPVIPELYTSPEPCGALTNFDQPDGGGLLPADGVVDNQDALLNENHSQVSFGCLGICSGDCIDFGGFNGKSFSKVH